MARLLALLVLGVGLSGAASAEETIYEARVEGMVCAFCAYNVGKTVGNMTGVDAASVDVNLEKKRLVFQSATPVSGEELAAIFKDSGFTLSALQEIDVARTGGVQYQTTPIVSLDLHGITTKDFASLLEALGGVAASQNLRVSIEAPEAIEIDLLKPLLMGRRPALNVQFSPIAESEIRLRMYPVVSTTSR